MHLTQLADPFETIEQCLQVTQDTEFNCYRWLNLCKNGGFNLVLTDIVNEGVFLRIGYSIQATQMGNGDGPAGFDGILADDGSFTSQVLGGSRPFQNHVLTELDRINLDEDCSALAGRPWLPR